MLRSSPIRAVAFALGVHGCGGDGSKPNSGGSGGAAGAPVAQGGSSAGLGGSGGIAASAGSSGSSTAGTLNAGAPSQGGATSSGSGGMAGISGALEGGGAGEGGDAQNGGQTSAGGSGGAGGATQSEKPTEKALAPLPQVRQEHSVLALAGEIYVVGGYTPQAVASVAAYNPTTNTWRSRAAFPVVLQHANAAVVGGKIYVAGFYQGSSQGANAVDGRIYVYDPAQNAWSPNGTMPQGSERGSACVAVLDEKMYLFGGAQGSDGAVADASVYEPASGEWEELPPLPEPREHCAAGAIGGKLYIASGRSGPINGFQPKTWEYDPVARQYTEKAPIPTPRGGTAAAVLRNKFIVFGGEGSAAEPGGVFPQVEAYDPVTDQWEPLPDMIVPRHGFGAAVLDDRLYLPGGATRQGAGAVDNHSVFYFE